MKDKAVEKPCDLNKKPKETKAALDVNSPADILPYANKFPANKTNSSSMAEVSEKYASTGFGAPTIVPGLAK